MLGIIVEDECHCPTENYMIARITSLPIAEYWENQKPENGTRVTLAALNVTTIDRILSISLLSLHGEIGELSDMSLSENLRPSKPYRYNHDLRAADRRQFDIFVHGSVTRLRV